MAQEVKWWFKQELFEQNIIQMAQNVERDLLCFQEEQNADYVV